VWAEERISLRGILIAIVVIGIAVGAGTHFYHLYKTAVANQCKAPVHASAPRVPGRAP